MLFKALFMSIELAINAFNVQIKHFPAYCVSLNRKLTSWLLACLTPLVDGPVLCTTYYFNHAPEQDGRYSLWTYALWFYFDIFFPVFNLDILFCSYP